MAERKLVVQIVGDASSYTKALNQATQSTKAFGRQMNAAMGAAGRPLDPLLAKNRQLQAQADDLIGSFRRSGEAAAGGFGRLAGKVGLLGVGMSAAFSASRHLREALETTGDAAFTTEGRIKNLGAALASGDIIGGLQALFAQESRLAPDLEKAVALLKQMGDEASRVSLKDVIGNTEKFQAAVAAVAADYSVVTARVADAADRSSMLAAGQAGAADNAREFKQELQAAVVAAGLVEKAVGGIVEQMEAVLNLPGKIVAGAAAALPTGSPQFLQTAVARERAGGDERGLLEALRKTDKALTEEIAAAKASGLKGKELNKALEQLFSEQASVRREIEQILKPDKVKIPKVDTSAADALATAIRQQKEAFAKVLGFLDIRLDKARASRGFKDDLRLLEELEASVRAQIRVEGRTVELERRLLTIESERVTIARQRKEIADRQRQADQFRALGLTALGDEQTPAIANLQKQLKSITERVADTNLDTPKTRGLLEKIRKVLTDPVEKATVETRAKIKELFATIREGFEEGAGSGPLTKTSGLNTKKILEGLGLDAATEAEIRSRLSGFNSAGRALASASTFRPGAALGAGIGTAGATYVLNNPTFNGVADIKEFEAELQKRRRRNPQQKRGMNRIGA